MSKPWKFRKGDILKGPLYYSDFISPSTNDFSIIQIVDRVLDYDEDAHPWYFYVYRCLYPLTSTRELTVGRDNAHQNCIKAIIKNRY